MDATNHKVENGDAIWIPAGIALGAGFGSYLDNTSMGMSIGLMVGATISMLADHRNGKRSVVWPVVGGLAIVWTLALVLVGRA